MFLLYTRKSQKYGFHINRNGKNAKKVYYDFLIFVQVFLK